MSVLGVVGLHVWRHFSTSLWKNTVNNPRLIHINQWARSGSRSLPSTPGGGYYPASSGAAQSAVRAPAAVSRGCRVRSVGAVIKENQDNSRQRFSVQDGSSLSGLCGGLFRGEKLQLCLRLVHVPSGGVETRSGGSHRLSPRPDSRLAAARRRHDPHTELRPPQPAAPPALCPHPGTPDSRCFLASFKSLFDDWRRDRNMMFG